MSAQRAAQLVEAGAWLQATGDLDGARRLFEQALKLDPSNAKAKKFLGVSAGPAAGPPPAAAPAAPAADPFRSSGASAPSLANADWGDLLVNAVGATPSALSKEAGPSVTASHPSRPPAIAKAKEVDPLDLVGGDPVAERAADAGADEVATLLRGAKDLLDLDDHTGAIELIAKAEQLDPGNQTASALRSRSEKTLLAMYESKVGPLQGVPKIKLKQDEIIWLNLDHRAGFVLSQIDGRISYEEIFELSGMSRLDTARILAQLIDEGVIRT